MKKKKPCCEGFLDGNPLLSAGFSRVKGRIWRTDAGRLANRMATARLGSARSLRAPGSTGAAIGWEPFEAQVCRVADMTPLGVARRLPYPSIELEPAPS